MEQQEEETYGDDWPLPLDRLSSDGVMGIAGALEEDNDFPEVERAE